MHVHVTLKGGWANLLADGQTELVFGGPVAVEEVIARLELPARNCVVVLNGTAVRAKETLADGDRLLVYPPLAGG